MFSHLIGFHVIVLVEFGLLLNVPGLIFRIPENFSIHYQSDIDVAMHIAHHQFYCGKRKMRMSHMVSHGREVTTLIMPLLNLQMNRRFLTF